MGQSDSRLKSTLQGGVDLINRKRRKSISEQDRIVIDGSSLACPVCFSAFQKPIRVLQCGHSFCNNCLKRLINAKVYSASYYVKQVECPLCRQTSTFGPEKDLTVNHNLNDILDSVEMITADEADKNGQIIKFNLDPNVKFEIKRLKLAATIAENELKAKELECARIKRENGVLVQFLFGCIILSVIYKLYTTYFS